MRLTSMMVNGRMIKKMEKVFFIGMMVTSMMVNLKMVIWMEKVFFILLMAANKNVFTKMVTKSVVNSYDWLIEFEIRIFNTI